MSDRRQLGQEIREILARLEDVLNRIEAQLSFEERRVLLDSLSPLDISTFDKFLSLRNQSESLEITEGLHPNTDSGLQSDIEDPPNSTVTCPQSNTSSRKNHTESSRTQDSPNKKPTKSGESGFGTTKFSACQLSISQKLRDNLAQCADRPECFWEKIGNSPVSISAGLESAFFEIYDDCEDAELVQIYRRFKMRNFYLLAVDLDYHTGERWCREASVTLAKNLALKRPSRDTKEADFKSLVDKYVRLGRKYDRWATELGGEGYLIALPLNITEREYTNAHFSKYIPLAIRKLREGGIDQIVKEHGYDKLGNHISERLRTQLWPSGPARRHLTKSARRNKRKREAKQDETTHQNGGPGTQHSQKRKRRDEVYDTRPTETPNPCPREGTPREINENPATNSTFSHTRPESAVDFPTRSSCTLTTPQESSCQHLSTQDECSSRSGSTYSKDEPPNMVFDNTENTTELPIGLLDQPPLDPFPSSDFPHNLFDNSHELLNDLLDEPSLDPFPASDFPDGLVAGPPVLPIDLSAQSVLDPFPASDFPRGHFDDSPARPVDLELEALDPFPESDFPHRFLRNPIELAYQSLIITSSNCFSPEPSCSDPTGSRNCEPRPPGCNGPVCNRNARPTDDSHSFTWDKFRLHYDSVQNSPNYQSMMSKDMQSEAHNGTSWRPTPMVPAQL